MLQRRILGVDAGSTAVKVVQVEVTPLGKRAVTRLKLFQNLESFAELLENKGWWKPGDQVHLGFPSDQLIVRNLTLPFQDPGKIQQTLPYELEGDIPLSVEEMVANCIVLGRGKEGTDLLALASSREAVAAWLERMRTHGVEPVILEPEVTAISQVVPATSGDTVSTLAVIDIGASKTNVVFVQSQTVRSARCIRLGLGNSPSSPPLPDALLREIDRTIKTMRLQEEAKPLKALLLSGGGAQIAGITEWLEARLNISVQLLNPLRNIHHTVSDTSDEHIARFGTAVGIALSGQKEHSCNLRVGPFVYRPGLSMFRGRTLAAGILLMLALALGLGDLYAHLTTRQKALKSFKEESHRLFAQAFPGVNIVDPALQMRRLLEEQKARSFSLLGQDPRGSSVEILREISLRVQGSVRIRLKEFDLSGDVVSLRGEADRYNTIEKAKDRWRDSPLLEDVEVKTAKKNPKTQFWEFQIVARRVYS